MGSTCCVGRPAAGKTQAAIDLILKTLADKPFGRVWVIVPGLLPAVHFRRRLAAAGGAVGARVGSFANLANELLEAHNAGLPSAPAPFANVLLRQVAREAWEAGHLKHYEPIMEFPGFVGLLRDAFRELRFGFVDPEAFTEIAAGKDQGTRELAWMYAAYEQRLLELGWGDASGQPRHLCQQLQQHPEWLAHLDLLVVDGFDSFTGAELALLQSMAAGAKRMFITLPAGDGSGRTVHRRAEASLVHLRQSLPLELLTLKDEPRLPGDLTTLERHLMDPAPVGYKPPYPKEAPTITRLLLEAYSPEAETREALRWLKARIVRDGVSPSDCAIFMSDKNLYEPALQLAAREFGMPMHFFSPRPFLSYPVGAALLNLLDLPAQEYRTGALLNFLRSPFFGTPLHQDRIAVDELDELSRYARILAGWEQWQDLFSRLLKAEQDPNAEDRQDRKRKNLPDHERTRQLQTALEGIFGLLGTFAGQVLTPAGWVASLQALLDQLDFYERARGEAGEQVLEPFFDSLRAVVMSEAVLGAEPVDYAGFYRTLHSTIASLGLAEPLAHNPDGRILVASMEDARAVRYRAVVLMGLGEGILPKRELADPVLSEALRQELGLMPMLGREQAGLFYQALARADEYMLITRAYLTESGEPWGASPYWKSMVEWLGEGAVERIDSRRLLPADDAASLQEALFASRLGLPSGLGGHAGLLERLQEQADLLRSRRRGDEFDEFDGQITQAEGLLGRLFGPDTVWSASGLETYGTCPMYHFTSYALRLDERLEPEEDFDAAQLGSINHLILERLLAEAADPCDTDALRQRLPVVAKEVFGTAPFRFGFRPSALWVVQQKEILRSLDKTLLNLGASAQEWLPSAFELKFGFGVEPAFDLATPLGVHKLRGSIDRVDRNQNDESLRVIDYKTSSAMDKSDFTKKKRLQFMLYAMAVEEHFKLGPVSQSLYWSINSATIIGPRLDDTGDSEKMRAFTRETVDEFVFGMRSGHFIPQAPEDGCPDYCPAARWCWHYVNKD